MNQMNLSKWLKCITIIVAIMGSVVLFIILPRIGRDIITSNPECKEWYAPWFAFFCIIAIPCYVALGVFWTICNEIGKDNSFSMENAKSLSVISKLAVFDSVICFVGNVIFLSLGMSHFIVIIGFPFAVMGGIAIAVVAAALAHLVEKAYKMKEENDLTI
ncbi:MAG TPA: DUF2975 domain-containing protein [Lachnospiraceae bacterium]|nr:DUF2975 domain-containing protein [Lachnospiraceae bacterium]HEX3076296.1 DUF2975 domain-containing protein [Lachnospiraceae bacterium]